MQTKGEYRVGISFNPSASGLVDEIKRKAADLIDLIDSIHPHAGDGNQGEWGEEVVQLKDTAQRGVEIAAMMAVKAATKPERV
ncbi:DUF7681 family protein [Paracoccus lutimaris]|uniref:Acb2/Tad1 hairpin domain-containing protein n=1 Tax=Paracoccus lutimaris TaxID=1490030 RepID=A0A368YBV4_9RHOB|nr:hypothetical protein [Paracoccus lutimaris]RCW77733.1 hypothetical protein DFP89_1604 [Paracoccus lutimaris]